MKGLTQAEIAAMPSKAMGDEKAAELYALDNRCEQCGKEIATLEEAIAVHFTYSRSWKLTHRKHCAFNSIFETNPKLARRVS